MLYEDEADIHLNPHLTRGWFLRGAPRRVPAPGLNQKRSLFGAFNPRTGRLLVHTVRHKSAEGFKDFLRCVLRAYAGRHVYLVIDNGPIHTAAESLRFIEEHQERLTVLWLPRYSPNLNLIERLWGYLKRSALANIFHGTVGRLMVAIACAVRAFNDHRSSLLRIIFAQYQPKKTAA